MNELRRVMTMAKMFKVVFCVVLALAVASTVCICQAPGGTLSADPAVEAARKHIVIDFI